MIPKQNKLKAPSGGVSGFFRRLWAYLVFCCIGIRANFKEIFTFHKKFDLKKVPRRVGEVAVITGGARGIGIEIVKKLLILDMHVVIGCRNRLAAIDAVEFLRKSGISTGTTNILTLDLASLASVRDFASKVNIKYPKIHILINNGGIMVVPYNITVDGNESHFQVNYLSHFLLTNLLIPKLIRGGRQGKTNRIVNVSSAAHYGGKINFEDINMSKMYCKTMGYMSSKLMQVVNTKDLNHKFEKEGVHVRCYAVHPGVVKTDLYEHIWLVKSFGFLFRLFYKHTYGISKNPEQGADGVVFAAISSKFEGEGGHYFSNCKKTSVNLLAKKVDVQKRLWELSCKLTGWEDTPMSEIVKQTMISARGGNKGPSLASNSNKEQKNLKSSESQAAAKSGESENAGKIVNPRQKISTTEVPRISVVSASSHSTISNNTVVGNDDIAVIIIPATATEASSSSSSSDEEEQHDISQAVVGEGSDASNSLNVTKQDHDNNSAVTNDQNDLSTTKESNAASNIDTTSQNTDSIK